jgi:hypothetical protein
MRTRDQVQGLDKTIQKDTIQISLVIWCWATFYLQYSHSPSWNGLVQVLNSSGILIPFLLKNNCCSRNVGGGNLFPTLTHSLTHSLRSALLEKPPIVQPLKNFSAFYGTLRFITVFTRTL